MNKNDNNKNPVIKGAVVTRLGDILHDSDGLSTLVKLNLLFIATCLPFIPFLPVFTVGPALKALMHCTNELVRTGYIGNIKSKYMSAFKTDIIKSIRAGAALIIFGFVFASGLYFYLIMSADNIFYIPFASVSLLILLFIFSVSVHLFPFMSEGNYIGISSKELFSLSVSSVITGLVKTLTAVLISIAVIIAQILFLPASLPLIITLGFSVPALCCAFAHTEPEFV